MFAYGATGAGKTHTMLGREGDPGIMYLTTMELYRRLEARQEEKQFEVLISYLEVGLPPLWPTSYFILRTLEEGVERYLGRGPRAQTEPSERAREGTCPPCPCHNLQSAARGRCLSTCSTESVPAEAPPPLCSVAVPGGAPPPVSSSSSFS